MPGSLPRTPGPPPRTPRPLPRTPGPLPGHLGPLPGRLGPSSRTPWSPPWTPPPLGQRGWGGWGASPDAWAPPGRLGSLTGGPELCDLPPDALEPPSARRRFRVTWRPGPAHRDVTLEPDSDESWSREPVAPQELFWPEMGGADPAVLREQVETCRELLELEPRSRSSLLTLSFLLCCLDPAAHEAESQRCLQALLEADPLRGGFVRDLRSRAAAAAGILRLQQEEEEEEEGREAPPPLAGPRLRLAGCELTSLPLLERLGLLTRLELGGNRLRGPPAGLGGLRRLRVLDLSHNEVATLAGLPPLPRLEELLLDGNPISHAPALAPLAACPRLARLGLAGTPLAAAPGAAAHLAELLPRVEVALA